MGNFVSFSGSMTIREADGVAKVLRQALEDQPEIILDCDQIEEADLTFLQLVIAARRSAGHVGKGFSLSAPPRGALLAALDRAGIRPEGEHLFWFEGASAR